MYDVQIGAQDVLDDFVGDDVDGWDFARMTDDGCPLTDDEE